MYIYKLKFLDIQTNFVRRQYKERSVRKEDNENVGKL